MSLFSRPAALMMGTLGLLLAVAGRADADFVIRLQAGNATLNIADGSALDGDPDANSILYQNSKANLFGGGFLIKALGSSTNNPGDPDVGGLLDLSSLSITNMGKSTQTISVAITSTGFEEPSLPGSLIHVSSVFGGQFTFASGVTVTDHYTYQVTADQSAAGGADFGKGILLNPSVLTYDVSGNKNAPQGFGRGSPDDPPNQEGFFTRADGTGYSLSSFSTITLAPGDKVGFSGSVTAVDPVPAPPGLILALAGGGPLGLAGWVRHLRRKRA